jgi:hypothetical protein
VSEHLPVVPSDQSPRILETGRGDVVAAVFSMSARSPTGEDARYLEWHSLDHLPEQYRLEGLRHGARWVSTPACREARALKGGKLDAVDHVVNYLSAPPVRQTFELGYELMLALDEIGRMPTFRPPQVYVGLFGLTGKVAAARTVAGADVLPWRPARGAYVLVEEIADEAGGDRGEELDALVELNGVAGVWRYAGGYADRNPQVDSPPGHRVTVCYLDADPVDTAHAISPVLRARWSSGGIEPLLAAPFEVLVHWDWARSLP